MGYRVGDWTVDPSRGLASREDERVHLEPKATELLTLLAARPGEVVSRDELLDRIWPDVTVGDEVVTNAIAKLRKALGDDPRSPRLIETIPKRGYRMVAAVAGMQTLPHGGAARRQLAALTIAAVAVSTAVLLAILLPLSATEKTQTAPPNDVRAKATASTPLDPEIQAIYRQGLAAYQRGTPEDLVKAVGLFEQVVTRNPTHGPSLATLAAIYWQAYRELWHRRFDISPRVAALRQAKIYLDRALMSPTPLAHRINAAMLIANRRYEAARNEAQAAVTLDPYDPSGHLALAEVLTYTESADEAIPHARRAMALTPKPTADQWFTLGLAQLVDGRTDDAALSLERARQLVPDDRIALMALISAFGTNGQSDKAKSLLTNLEGLQHRDKLVSPTITWLRERLPFEAVDDREHFLDGLRKAGVPEW